MHTTQFEDILTEIDVATCCQH